MRTSKLILILGTVLSAAAPATVYAQAATTGASDDTSAIIVTARRVEERLQDVPISITVFNQQQLADKNVKDATDLATYTPSLAANNNFGQDNISFAIRGFAQDIGTAPSVGTYFGDVVVPRGGSNGQPIGDSAGPGDFFDLQNVEVLKGPQGTLFGYNTTGGAVIFVPQKPTDKFEGYVMGGYGNYNQRHIQAVINVPLADTFRVRLGVDRLLQDGYLHNVSGIGPSRFDNTDSTAVRLSMVGDLTPNLENYVIASYSRSSNTGALGKLVAGDASAAGAPFGGFAAAQIAQQGKNFYNVENPLPDAGLRTTTWQIIDTTTWKATDTLTIKNIASYAQLKQQGNSPIFGINWQVPVGGTVYNSNFEESASPPGLDSANESTFTEEFRFQGNSSDNRLTYQTGAYLEIVSPLSQVGAQSPGFASCADGNGATFNCTDPYRPNIAYGVAGPIAAGLGIPVGFVYPGVLAAIPPIGNINYTVGKTSFHDVGLYAQSTYKLTDQFKVTGGFRYTWDHEAIDSNQYSYLLNPAPTYGVASVSCENFIVTTVANKCFTHYYTKSQKPTWLIDFDYTPTRDLLAYVKYSRGYRASTIAPNIPEAGTAANPDTTLNYIKPEKVDAFEVGLKSSFAGALHGTFNVAGFYNNFSNQQLQVGFSPTIAGFAQTAAPVNAGKSKIYGAEIEAAISPIHGLELTLGYTYLRTRIDEVLAAPTNPAYDTIPAFHVGDSEVLSPRNKLVAGATYTLPTPSEWGKMSIGGSVTYRSSELTNFADRNNPDPAIAAFSYLPALTLVDLSGTWVSVAGKPFDLGFFVTNLTNKKYYNYAAGLGGALGFETATVGAPRMFGGTLKVHFGQ